MLLQKKELGEKINTKDLKKPIKRYLALEPFHLSEEKCYDCKPDQLKVNFFPNSDFGSLWQFEQLKC